METKDVIQYLGYNPEEIKSIDDLKTKFDEDFVKRSIATTDKKIVDSVAGKHFSITEQKVEKLAKMFEIDVTSDEFKSDKVYDKFDKIMSAVGEKHTSSIKSLQDQVKGDGGDALKAEREKYEKLHKRFTDYDNLLKTTREELENEKKNSANTIKNFRVKQAWDSSLNKLKYSKDTDDLRKRGFVLEVESNYEIDIDDQDNLFIRDKKTGSQIKSDKKAGSFYTIDEILEKEAVKYKVIDLAPDQKNKSANNNQFNVFKTPGDEKQQANKDGQYSGRYARTVHPKARS